MKKILIISIAIIIFMSLGSGTYIYYNDNQLRNELFDNIYDFQIQRSCRNFETIQESEACKDIIECYVKKTVDKVKYVNLRRWIHETKPQFNPYYTIRGHLREEGITELELDEMRDSCQLIFIVQTK